MSKSKLILVVAVAATLGTPLVSASGAFGSPTARSKATTPAFSDFKRFLRDTQHDRTYTIWATANPRDLARWRTFRNGLLALGNGTANQVPAVPKMTTPFGRELADVGVLYLDGTSGEPGPNGGNGAP